MTEIHGVPGVAAGKSHPTEKRNSAARSVPGSRRHPVDAGSAPRIPTIAIHKELAAGMLRAIYRQVLRFVSEEDLRPTFYA